MNNTENHSESSKIKLKEEEEKIDNSIEELDSLEDNEQISIEVAEIIDDLPVEKRKLMMRALIREEHHSGPLPDARTIMTYNEVIPNGGDRLMKNVEKQLSHRIDIEKTGVKRSYNQSSTGQWMGFSIALVFGVIAWDLARKGHTTVAAILGTVDLVALVTVFVIGVKKK